MSHSKAPRRIVSIAVTILLASILGVGGQVNAAGAGSTCLKLGSTKKVKTVSLLCKRVGKKNIWTIATKSNSQVIAPATPAVPTGWSDLEAKAGAVPYASWKLSSQAISGGTSAAPTAQLINGANNVVTNANPENGIRLASRLFAGAPNPSQLTLLRFGASDVSWAQTQWSATFGTQDSSVGSEMQSNCSSATTCWGGNARLSSSGSGWIAMGSMQANSSSSRHTSGALEAHEYTHLIQMASLGGVSTSRLPRWLLEGMATYTQAAILGATSFDSYAAERRRETGGFSNGVSWLETFLAPTGSDWSPWNSYQGNDSWRVYDVGFLATEVLVALKGPSTAMKLYQEVGAGKTFDAAFAELYGIAWSDAYKIIAKVIALQIGK